MAVQITIWVDPAELYLPPSRQSGADPLKFTRQLSLHGISLDGMPAIHLVRGAGGLYRVNDGVTRATRAARFRPGERIEAVIIEDRPGLDVTVCKQVKECLP